MSRNRDKRDPYRRQVSRNHDRHDLYSDECHEFVTRFFNNGHPLPGTFSGDRLSISAQTLNKFCAVVVHIATCFSFKKKVMRNNKINSIEKYIM